MSSTNISKRYALALVELAEDKKELERFQNSLKLFLETLREHSNFKTILFDPKISKEAKELILKDVGSKLNLPKKVLNFFLVLNLKTRILLVEEVIALFDGFVMDALGIAKAKIITSTPVDEDTKQNLLASCEGLTKKKILPEFLVDPFVLGGVLFRIGSIEIDGSIQNYFNKIQKISLN